LRKRLVVILIARDRIKKGSFPDKDDPEIIPFWIDGRNNVTGISWLPEK